MWAWWLLPAYFALIAICVEQFENWLTRRERRARREGRRQALEWQRRRDTARSPW
jgi:hypothetical protein